MVFKCGLKIAIYFIEIILYLMEGVMVKNTVVILCCAFIVGCFSQNAFAVSDNGNNGNGTPGQPNAPIWQAVYSQLDALQLEVDGLVGDMGSLEDRLAANEEVINNLNAENEDLLSLIEVNRGDIEDLQEQVDANTILINQLQDQVDQIEKALAFKQNVVEGTCPSGEAIRLVNEDGSVVCQNVSGGGGTSASFRVYNYVDVPPYQPATVEVTCPEGTTLSGGGSALAFTHYYLYYKTQLGGTSIEGNTMTAKAHGAYSASNVLTVYGLCVQ